MTRIYLAGPIKGLSYEEATRWRKDAAAYLTGGWLVDGADLGSGIEIYDPMRGKEELRGVAEIPSVVKGSVFTDADYIFQSDTWHIRNSDIVLVNLLGAKETWHIGTMFEIGYAYALKKQVIVVSDVEDVVLHPFIKNGSMVVPDFAMAYRILEALI